MKEVISVRRVRTATGAVNVFRHNIRAKDLSEYIDQTITQYNTYDDAGSVESFRARYDALLAEAKLKRKPQKNASKAIEYVISTSHDYCADWLTNPESKKQLDEYFRKSLNYIKRRHGDVVLSSAVHWDETTPHLHVLCIPLCRVKGKNEIKYSSSDFIGGRKELSELHTSFHEQVGKEFGLERGEEGSRTSHNDLQHYNEWIRNEKASLVEKENELSTAKNDFDKKNDEITELDEKLKNKALEYRIYESEATAEVPVIPPIPSFTRDEEKKTWRDSIQNMVKKAFLKMAVQYDQLAAKFNNLLDLLNRTKKERDAYKERARKAEYDLAHKPVDEIRNERINRADHSCSGPER